MHVKALTTTFGNADAATCAKNAIALLQVLDRECQADAKARLRFQHVLEREAPVIALGADGPLSGKRFDATYYHGRDGLQNVHTTHKHISPHDAAHHFASELPAGSPFQTTTLSSADYILDTLAKSPPKTISIIAIGPLTNLALAAQKDAATFSRVKRIIIMGGAVDLPGNVTPNAEFNFYADPQAVDVVFRMSVTDEIRVSIIPLDLSTPHKLNRTHIDNHISSDTSHLREFCSLFLSRTMDLIDKVYVQKNGDENDIPGLEMHDGVAVWYALAVAQSDNEQTPVGWTTRVEDVRMETTGTFTRGMCVVDRRTGALDENMKKEAKPNTGGGKMKPEVEIQRGDGDWAIPLTNIEVVTKSPGYPAFRKLFLSSVFGANPEHVN